METRVEQPDYFNNEHTNRLPKELWGKVFNDLDRASLNSARLACSFFYRVSMAEQVRTTYYPLLDYSQLLAEDESKDTIDVYNICNVGSPLMLAMSNDVIVLTNGVKLVVIDFNKGAKPPSIKTLCNGPLASLITGIKKISQRELVCVYENRNICLWNIDTATCFKTWNVDEATWIPRGVPSSNLLAVKKDGSTLLGIDGKIWKFSQEEEPTIEKPFLWGGYYRKIFVNKSNQLITIDHENVLRVYDWDGSGVNAKRCPLAAQESYLLSDNRLLGTRDDTSRDICIWNFETNQCQSIFKPQDAKEYEGFIGYDFKLIGGDVIATRGKMPGENGMGFFLCDMSGKPINKIPCSKIQNSVFMPDGRLIIFSEKKLRTLRFQVVPQLEKYQSHGLRRVP